MVVNTTLQVHLLHGDLRISQRFENDTLSGRTVDHAQLVECTLEKVDMNFACLTGLSLQDSDIYNSRIVETHFDQMTASGLWHKDYIKATTFNNCRFVDNEFAGCVFNQKDIFTRTKFRKVVFSGCEFENIRFDQCDFVDVLFIDCTFKGVHSASRPQLTTEVKFLNSTFTQTRFKRCKFFKRTNPYGSAPSGKLADSTTFHKSTVAGTLFSGCDVDGLDYTDLYECIFDNDGIEETVPATKTYKLTNVHGPVDQRDTQPIPRLSDKAPPKAPLTAEDDDGWDEWDSIYAAYGYWQKPKNTGKPRPYRFFTSGLSAR